MYPDWIYRKSWGGFLGRRPDRAVNICAVERTTSHLELAIEVGSDPISGSISNELHLVQPFNGWMELVAAIEAARSSDGDADMLDAPRLKTWGRSLGRTARGSS